jgi:hypothetical protein
MNARHATAAPVPPAEHRAQRADELEPHTVFAGDTLFSLLFE